MSVAERASGESCLLAQRRRGRLSVKGEERTDSKRARRGREEGSQLDSSMLRIEQS